MRTSRFTQFLTEQLRAAGVSVETHSISGVDQPQPLVRCDDGTSYYLHVVGTAPPGGDDPNTEEKILEREAGTQIAVTRRAG